MLQHRDNARGSVGSRWPWSSAIAVWASECRLKAFLTRPAPALPPARESGVPRETLWWLIAFNHITRLQEEWAAIESAGKYSCSALKPTHSTFIQAAYCMCARKQIHIYYGLKILWGKKKKTFSGQYEWCKTHATVTQAAKVFKAVFSLWLPGCSEWLLGGFLQAQLQVTKNCKSLKILFLSSFTHVGPNLYDLKENSDK